LKFTLTLKMEVAWSSKRLVSNHSPTWHSDRENHEFYLHCCETSNLTLKYNLLTELFEMGINDNLGVICKMTSEAVVYSCVILYCH